MLGSRTEEVDVFVTRINVFDSNSLVSNVMIVWIIVVFKITFKRSKPIDVKGSGKHFGSNQHIVFKRFNGCFHFEKCKQPTNE